MDDRDRLSRPAPWVPWALTSLALVIVALVAYALGVREAAAVTDVPVRRAFFGGGGFWILFGLFWVFLGGFRRCWWWGYHPYAPWHYRPYRYGPYEPGQEDWDDWHRRAHDRMGQNPGAGGPSHPDRGPTT